MKTQLIIDTDIGTDPDDAFAIAYAIKNPTAEVAAITVVQGIPYTRAKIARKLERLLGVDVPITVGKDGPDFKKYIGGFELQALTDREFKEPIKELPFPEYNEKTKLVAIGPLTNIAYQLENNPAIRNVKDIYVMGNQEDSHNFKVDIAAARKVFQQPWNIYQITKTDSKQVCFTLEELEKFKEHKLGAFLYDSTKRWFNYTGKTDAPMYDVITVSAALGEPYVKFKQIAENRFVSNGVDVKIKDKIMEAIR
jgi:purine nucleosidase